MASAASKRVERRARDEQLIEGKRRAAELFASGFNYRDIAEVLGCSVSTAHDRVQGYFDELARSTDLERHRQQLAAKHDWLFAQLAQELRLVQSAPLRAGDAARADDEALAMQAAGEGEIPAQTLRTRTYLIATLAKRLTDLFEKEARVVGLYQEEPDGGPGGIVDAGLADLRLPDDPERLAQIAAAFRGLRRLIGPEQGGATRLLEAGD